jgi:nickel-dependent lactate racemase
MGSQDEMTYSVPYGRGSVSFRLPEGVSGEMARSGQLPPMADPAAAAREAVRKPIGTLPLRELARGKRNVVIAVTDATRACPDHLLVPPMLEELAAAGVPDDAINLLVAVGMHRASTEAEKREKLGDAIVDRYRIVDHNGSDRDQLAFVIDGPGGTPFYVNRLAVEADLLLATGRVEPHQYGGYSGGGKGVAIGCAGEEIIAYTHGPAMLDLPGTRLAALEGNPFQEAVRRVAKAVGLAFVGNIVMDDEERPVAIAYGAPEAVQNHLAEIAGKLYTAPIPGQFDIAVAGVGYPKDANLYQASRAASYLQFAPVPVVRNGGVIIIPATCPEGAGEGVGEQQFKAEMSDPAGLDALIERARRDGIRPGAQRAYVMARVLQDVQVIIAGAERPDDVRAVRFLPAATIEDALAMATKIVGAPAMALIVPHALLTLPVVTNSAAATAMRDG